MKRVRTIGISIVLERVRGLKKMAVDTHHSIQSSINYGGEMAAVAFKKQNHDYKIKL